MGMIEDCPTPKSEYLRALREVRATVLEMTAFRLNAPDELRHAGAFIKDGLLVRIDAMLANEGFVRSCASCVGWVRQTCIEAEADGQWDSCSHWGIPTLLKEETK
jgi:hypothetical protein